MSTSPVLLIYYHIKIDINLKRLIQGEFFKSIVGGGTLHKLIYMMSIKMMSPLYYTCTLLNSFHLLPHIKSSPGSLKICIVTVATTSSSVTGVPLLILPAIKS